MRTVWYDGWGVESPTPFIFSPTPLYVGTSWCMTAYCSQINGYASTNQSIHGIYDVYYPSNQQLIGYVGLKWYRGYNGYSFSITTRNYYELRFSSNNGLYGEVSLTYGEYLEGSKVTVKAIPKNGYRFVAWDDGDKNANRTFTAKSDSSYIAIFEPLPITFTVFFDSNGGEGPEMSSQNFEYGVSKKLEKNTYSKTGYVFIGWKINDVGDLISDGSDGSNLSKIRDSSVYLYAQWRRVYFDVTIENSRTDTGTLSLLFAGNVVATESGGVLSYEGKSGVTYEIVCELKNRLYAPLGVNIGGKYVSSFRPDEDESLSLTYEYQKKPTYAISLNFDSSKGEVAINTPSAETVDETEKWIGGDKVEISISSKSESGWKFKIANILNGDISESSYTSLTDGKLNFTLGFDTTVKVLFERARYTYRAEIDGPSKGAITGVFASVEGESTDAKVEHGQSVTCSATVSAGYAFAGWYDGGNLVSTDNPYRHKMLKDTVLTAKAKVSVSLSVETGAGGNDNPPVLSVNGEVCENNQYSSEVVLGESLSYSLDKGDWFFDSWYSGGTPVPLPMEDTLTPTSAMNLVAKFTATQITRKLTVRTIMTKDGSPIATEGLITSTVAPKPPPSGPHFQGSTQPGTYEFEFNGTQYVRVSAETMAGEDAFNFFAGSVLETGMPDLGSVLSYEKDYDFLLNTDRMIYACYGELANVTTRFTFADGSDRTMGEISVGVDGATQKEDGSVEVNALQQSTIKVTARAKNGYEFVGWYSNRLGNGDALEKSAEAEIPVTTQRTLYAKFKKNPHAVYEWEGSTENKMMEWRSKVYAAPVPFNPSAARVDARGYGVALEVGMYSSPDGNPTRKAEIVVKNQDARRLPTLRPERYMQICVKNDAEVDAVIVGTSMKGLAV